MTATSWTPARWQSKPIAQQPNYPDKAAVERVKHQLTTLPPLVSPREIQKLRRQLAQVAAGEAFLLQGGDCAESFREFSQANLLSYFRVLLQMAVTLVYGTARPVIKVGRVAGQFAKPRSADVESHGGTTLPAYRGDMVNAMEFTADARTPDPERLLRAYWQSSATLNYLHALSRDGFAALSNIAKWNSEFATQLNGQKSFTAVIARIQEYVAFAQACGLSPSETEQLSTLDFYTSHEALLLDYEQALTRYDEANGPLPYVCSAHMLWIGNRTRHVDGAHVDFLRGVENPLGLKIDHTLQADELLELIDILNPHNNPGKLVLISRMGVDNIATGLAPLIEAVQRSGKSVIWSCDPMHGNTVKSSNGFKTRRFADILAEVQGFFRVHHELGTYPGGLHFEMTGQDVTECTGGMQVISEEDLNSRYHTHCDPRLNASQALELAFLAATELRK